MAVLSRARDVRVMCVIVVGSVVGRHVGALGMRSSVLGGGELLRIGRLLSASYFE